MEAGDEPFHPILDRAPPPGVIHAGTALNGRHLERRAPVVPDVRRHEVVRVARVDDHLRSDPAARARRCYRQGGPQRGGAGGQRCDGYPCHRRCAFGGGSLMS